MLHCSTEYEQDGESLRTECQKSKDSNGRGCGVREYYTNVSTGTCVACISKELANRYESKEKGAEREGWGWV